MFKNYGSLSYVLGAMLFRLPLGRKVRATRLLAGMSHWPFRPAALTCTGKTDGGGAQVHAVMSVLNFCDAFGYQYLHTPLGQMEHTPGASEVLEWEKIFNLGSGEVAASDCVYPIIPASSYIRSPRLWFQNVAVAVKELHEFSDAHPEAYLQIAEKLRRKYAGAPLSRSDDRLAVAVHIRRGDAAGGDKRRLTGDDAVLRRIDAVRRACGVAGRNCHIVIHSQGQAQDFKAFLEHGCELRLDASPLQSLNALVQADILLLAKSSFSYAAGLLSAGIVIYERFWHAPLPGWVDADHAGDIAKRLAYASHPASLGGA